MKNCKVEKKTYLVQEVTMEESAKAVTVKLVAGCEKSILVKELAEMLCRSGVETGEVRLYQWLREHGYVYRQPCGQNMPTKKSLEFGVLEVRKRQYEYGGGYKGRAYTLAVTPKGQEYFMLLLGGDNNCRKSA